MGNISQSGFSNNAVGLHSVVLSFCPSTRQTTGARQRGFEASVDTEHPDQMIEDALVTGSDKQKIIGMEIAW